MIMTNDPKALRMYALGSAMIVLAACGPDPGPIGMVTSALGLPPSSVNVTGNQLLVRQPLADGTLPVGRPYFVRGVVWQPATRAPKDGPNPDSPSEMVPYGFFFDGAWREPGPQGHEILRYWLRNHHSAPPQHYLQDIPLIRQMNANTVRVFNDFGDEPAVVTAILDDLYSNGLMVIMTVATSKDDLDLDRHLDIVAAYKDHPAILMWMLGNEWNLNLYYGGYASLSAAEAATQQAALEIKAVDMNHPVASSLGDGAFVSSATSVPAVDIWGLNIYRGASFGTLFEQWSSTGKPFFLSEFGTDSYQTSSYTADAGRAANVNGAVDTTTQANHVIGLWHEIEDHRSTAANSEWCVGGLVYEFNDELWPVGNYHVGLGGLIDYDGPDGLPGTADDDHGYEQYNPEGFILPGAHPDDVANEEYFGLVDADRTPKEAYHLLANAFGYTLHIGVEGDSNIFPEELAAAGYLTAAAAARMALSFLDPAYATSQEQIYATYHTGAAGTEMTPTELASAMNAEAPALYHFAPSAGTDQLEAIRRIVHWMDYVPPGGKHVPSLIPTGGDLYWKVVRGFVVDTKPFDAADPFDIPAVELRGVWLNDPRISGLGFNVFQTAAFFQAEYQAVDGVFSSIDEPPAAAHGKMARFAADWQRDRLRIARIESHRELRTLAQVGEAGAVPGRWLTVLADRLQRTRSAEAAKPLWQTRGRRPVQVVLAMLRQSLPSALRADAAFIERFDRANSLRRRIVTNLDDGSQYVLVALGERNSGSSPLRFHIVIEIDPDSSALTQATWADTGEPYPGLTQRDAVRIARRVVLEARSGTHGQWRRRLPAALARPRVSLVWSSRLDPSRFQPSYQIRLGRTTVLVHSDGRTERLSADRPALPL